MEVRESSQRYEDIGLPTKALRDVRDYMNQYIQWQDWLTQTDFGGKQASDLFSQDSNGDNRR